MELLEIEKELSGPDRESALVRYDGQLLALSDRLEAALREGLAPDEFAKCEPLREVIVTARKLLRLQVKNANGN